MNNPQLLSLHKSIEMKRVEMENFYRTDGSISEIVIQKSQELDKLIYEYQKVVNKYN